MIRKLIPLVLLAGLTACATTGTPPSASSNSSPLNEGAAQTTDYGSTTPEGQTCDAQPVQNLLGQTLTPALSETARRRAQAQFLRILRPGQVMTMEYNPARLNLILEKSDVISAIRCG